MFRAGLVPFPRLDRGLKSIAAVDKYGPFAGPVHAHAENGYDAVAIIDERGPITYAELERSEQRVGPGVAGRRHHLRLRHGCDVP